LGIDREEIGWRTVDQFVFEDAIDRLDVELVRLHGPATLAPAVVDLVFDRIESLVLGVGLKDRTGVRIEIDVELDLPGGPAEAKGKDIILRFEGLVALLYLIDAFRVGVIEDADQVAFKSLQIGKSPAAGSAADVVKRKLGMHGLPWHSRSGLLESCLISKHLDDPQNGVGEGTIVLGGPCRLIREEALV